MRAIGIWGTLVFLLTANAFAAAPEGHEKIYDAPTRVNMGGRPVTAEIKIFVDREAARQGDLNIALVTDVTKFIEETERDLETWVANHRNDCGERWDAGKPYIGFPTGAIRFALDLEYEYWTCGWNGAGKPRRMARETGGVDVTLIPEITDGKLQARLKSLTLKNRSGVNKYLPLEFVTRRVLESELKNLNDNPKFFRAPQPFHREGFVYDSIEATRENRRVIITARYRASGDEETLERLTQMLLEDGIVSER
jgi:hypothetical protein